MNAELEEVLPSAVDEGKVYTHVLKFYLEGDPVLVDETAGFSEQDEGNSYSIGLKGIGRVESRIGSIENEITVDEKTWYNTVEAEILDAKDSYITILFNGEKTEVDIIDPESEWNGLTKGDKLRMKIRFYLKEYNKIDQG